jgi:hypothetical protein
MQTFTLSSMASFAIAAMLISCSPPPPCNPCNDPALVVVPDADATAPVVQWEISQAVTHSDGTMTSSISIVSDPSVPVNLNYEQNVSTTVYANATDEESGVKCISLSGGFGFSCTQPGGIGLLGSGILDNQRDCSGLTVCGLKSMRLQQDNLEQFLSGCTPPKVLASGDFAVEVVVENMKGIVDTVTLTLHFAPATL